MTCLQLIILPASRRLIEEGSTRPRVRVRTHSPPLPSGSVFGVDARWTSPSRGIGNRVI